jgi:hypothetical protein
MKKIKEFLSPIKGGNYNGLEFGKWFMDMSRAGLISIFSIIMLTLGEFSPIEEWDPEWGFWGAEVFLGLILILIIFKTLQHWSDLKKHTSR